MSERNFWMIGADSKVYGPSDATTMLQWIVERRVTSTTQVALSPEGPWMDAGSFPEFADEFVAQAPPGAGAAASTATSAAASGATSGAARGSSWPHNAPPRDASFTPMASVADWPPANLQIVLLVSSLLNIVTGAGAMLGIGVFGLGTFGLGWCCCPLALVPLIIGIIQCVDYTAARRTEPRRYFERTQMWGILNIVMVVFSNVPALVCGILQLVWLGDARRKYLNQ